MINFPNPIPRNPRTPVWGVMESLIILNPTNAFGRDQRSRTAFKHGSTSIFGGYQTPWYIVKGRYKKPRYCRGSLPRVTTATIGNAEGGDSFTFEVKGEAIIRVELITNAPYGSSVKYSGIMAPKSTSRSGLDGYASIPKQWGNWTVLSATVTIEVLPDYRTGRLRCDDGIFSVRAMGKRQRTPPYRSGASS